uniref:Uncharacterized protein n=1 Tax=Arundo donax TaxID=35708 RepID=A0A0A9FJJ1_ARUDO
MLNHFLTRLLDHDSLLFLLLLLLPSLIVPLRQGHAARQRRWLSALFCSCQRKRRPGEAKVGWGR